MTRWQTIYSHKALTLCRGFDVNGSHVADVQIVDFEAGGKMRVMSEPVAGAPFGEPQTKFNKRTAQEWYGWVQSGVAVPPAGQLFSVTNGAPFINEADKATMSFPQKKWNTILSLGADSKCHKMPQGFSAKRYLGLSDPSAVRQNVYIDQYDGACQSDRATVERELSNYGGQPVSLFDATVAFHPQYQNNDSHRRRTFIGTRSTDNLWGGTQDRAYLMTTSIAMTNLDARAIFVSDFRTMYNLELDGGNSTQYHSAVGSIGSGSQPIPEVLVVYNAP